MALREALMIRYRAIIMENVAIFGSIIERSSNIDGNIIDRLDSCLGKISEAQDKMNTLDKVSRPTAPTRIRVPYVNRTRVLDFTRSSVSPSTRSARFADDLPSGAIL